MSTQDPKYLSVDFCTGAAAEPVTSYQEILRNTTFPSGLRFAITIVVGFCELMPEQHSETAFAKASTHMGMGLSI